MHKGLILIFLSVSIQLCAQKKIIDDKSYFDWKKIEKVSMSNSGNFLTWEVTPLVGDGFLFVYNRKLDKIDSIFKGKDFVLVQNESFYTYRKTPGYDTLRQCELNKIDKKKWPKDTLFVVNLMSDSTVKIPKFKSFKILTEGNTLAVLMDKNAEAPAVEATKCKLAKLFKKPKPLVKEIKSDGTQLIFRTADSILFKSNNVTDYVLSPKGNILAFLTHEKDKIDSFQLVATAVGEVDKRILTPKYSSIKNLTWHPNETILAFYFSQDTSKVKQYQLGVYDFSKNALSTFGDSLSTKPFEYKGMNDQASLQFYKNLPYLKIILTDRNVEIKDTLLDSEKVKLDIWHYQDAYIQPQQLIELKATMRKGLTLGLNLDSLQPIKWSADSLDFNKSTWDDAHFVLLENEKPYSIQSQWSSPALRDVYRLDLTSGLKILIKKAVEYGGYLSPDGKFYSYFDPKTKQHCLLNLDSLNEIPVSMTSQIKAQFDEDVNGQPIMAGPVASYGFNASSSAYYMASRDNVYEFSIQNKRLSCLTCNFNLNNEAHWEMQKWQNDSVNVSWTNSYFKGIHNKTKNEELRQVISKEWDTKVLISGPFKVAFLKKAQGAEVYAVRRSTVSQFPDLEIISHSKSEKLTDVNPQQSQYNWVSCDWIEWKNYSGIELEGLLFKPENYDPKNKYPLLIYYYELNSDNLYNYRAPTPSASTINPTEYASAGYLVFIPDIRYKPGYPAKSAYDCIMSGTDFVLAHYSIDSLRMGLQGQSWGGYQTAQLITMTKRYRAAMAGAPVGNMFSAYGGIRWGSGLNRQFQYESTQSRIGATIWDRPDLYIENSPLFHLHKVNTPLLIMANDKDGSVPWYQGIELYSGMRRLGKPCWMLNYNDDDHNLTKFPNKIDLSIRMRQFFDFYLNNGKEPLWMKEGINAQEKGKHLKYETQQKTND